MRFYGYFAVMRFYGYFAVMRFYGYFSVMRLTYRITVQPYNHITVQ